MTVTDAARIAGIADRIVARAAEVGITHAVRHVAVNGELTHSELNGAAREAELRISDGREDW